METSCIYTEENLCDRSREAVAYGLGYTDKAEMISEDLARIAYHKALAYRIECNVSDTFDENIKEFHAQCGLLRSSQIVPSPGTPAQPGARYQVIPVTAKRNMKADLGQELLATKIFSPLLRQCKRVTFPEKGLQKLETPLLMMGLEVGDDTADAVSLPFGLDFTFGTAIKDPRNAFSSKVTSFEVVRHDFQIEKGQKIGICVWRNEDRITNDVEGSAGQLSEAEQRKFYGPARVAVIQTGVVTAVYGSNREVFAHNINTYEGCSGAIIFLLDKDQSPESVGRDDHGKAIGVHAAGHVPHNLGMSVIEGFHNPPDHPPAPSPPRYPPLPREEPALPGQLPPPQQPPVKVQAGVTGRGVTREERFVKNILMDLYQNDEFRRLNTDPSLENLHKHVNHKFFSADRRNKDRLKAALRLMDALWTREERQNAISRSFSSDLDAATVFNSIDDWAKRAAHILSNPSTPKPSKRRKSALLGLGKAILDANADRRLLNFIPAWNDLPNPNLRTLRDYVSEQEVAIKIRNKQGTR
ncbi:expressed unknown protein [Seminavis robusta]|uniref:Uncharacterized protein n=1 Tax=Seminavis robusta TaxID=568900 RepID=A0A9N8F0K5_9STRA|nr:expressed unknown protein [Seminavis robusta]|eukprot:Sro2422_g327160.1 n/a (527) ;mRNA; r:1057-2637